MFGHRFESGHLHLTAPRLRGLGDFFMWYVYLIKSIGTDFIYTDSTNDLKRRFVEHNGSFVASSYRKVCTGTGSISVNTLFSPAIAQIKE